MRIRVGWHRECIEPEAESYHNVRNLQHLYSVLPIVVARVRGFRAANQEGRGMGEERGGTKKRECQQGRGQTCCLMLIRFMQVQERRVEEVVCKVAARGRGGEEEEEEERSMSD